MHQNFMAASYHQRLQIRLSVVITKPWLDYYIINIAIARALCLFQITLPHTRFNTQLKHIAYITYVAIMYLLLEYG